MSYIHTYISTFKKVSICNTNKTIYLNSDLVKIYYVIKICDFIFH